MAKTIAVIGGGLAGRLCAWQLAQAGWRVSLFDRGGREGKEAAAYIAAAMLAPLAEAIDATSLVTALGRQSVARWRRLLEQLPERVFLQQAGSLVVWHAQDKPLAHQFEQQLSRAWGGDCPAQWWQAAQLASEEPQLAGRFQTGLYLPDEGQLENRQVLSALGAALEREKVDCRWHSEVSPQQLAGQFDWLLDCRGFGAKADWNAAQGSRLRGVRGEVARVYAPEVSLRRPVRLLHPRYPLYIAPKPDHRFVIGATQLESESGAPASVRSGLELLSALYAVHPAFGEAQILELSSGLRPTLNHHDPEIRFNRQSRMVEVNGLFRHGFMISPAVSEIAVQLIQALANDAPLPEDEAGLICRQE